MIYIETLAGARDQVQAELDAAEKELAEFAKGRGFEARPNALSSELWNRASRAAKLEGQLQVLRMAAATEAVVAGHDVEQRLVFGQIRKDTEDLLLREDDTWSGRGNDLRRCYLDGVKDAAREVFSHLRFEEKARTV